MAGFSFGRFWPVTDIGEPLGWGHDLPRDRSTRSPFTARQGSKTHPIPKSPMVPAIDTRWPPCRWESGMGISELEVVARDGPIREANQDRRAKRVCPKGENRLKPIRVNRTIDTRIFSPDPKAVKLAASTGWPGRAGGPAGCRGVPRIARIRLRAGRHPAGGRRLAGALTGKERGPGFWPGPLRLDSAFRSPW